MKIIVFGTGLFFQNRKGNIDINDIVAFVDNSALKIGKEIEGIIVKKPVDINKIDYDFILIMTNYDNFVEIEKQLEDMGVSREKIITYEEYQKRTDGRQMKIYTPNNMYFDMFNDNRRILFITHQLSLTGAPLVLMNAIKEVQKKGYNPVVLSPVDGELKRDFIKQKVPVIVDGYINKENKVLWSIIRGFSFVWINTVDMAYVIDDIVEEGLKYVWWLHETDISYEILSKRIKMPTTTQELNTYGVGARVIESYHKNLMRDDIKELLYGIPDERISERKANKERIVFAIIGTIGERKGQDIFIEAINELTTQQRKKAEFWIIGGVIDQKYYNTVKNKSDAIPEIKLWGQVPHDKMIKMYEEIDVIVCPSRSDPMPVVVTEGLMNNKICIVSDRTGFKEYIENGINGYFCQPDKDSLAEAISNVLNSDSAFDCIKVNARKLYEEKFSIEAFSKNIERIIEL